MKRHEPPYSAAADPNVVIIDPYVVAAQNQQQQYMYAAQRRQQLNAAAGNGMHNYNHYSERPDSFHAEKSEHLYTSSKVEQGQWHVNNQGGLEGGNVTRSIYQAQMLDSEKQENKETRSQVHEQDMEIGYEDRPSPLPFEGLEHKFLGEITKLIKEQSDKEDAENARHREKMIEINTQYQEKLLSLRAHQANRREEFLRKESQARLQQYQQTAMNHNPKNTGRGDAQSHSSRAAATAEEARQAYAISQFDSSREQPQYPSRRRGQSTEGRVPYPSGRVYNTGARYYPDIA